MSAPAGGRARPPARAAALVLLVASALVAAAGAQPPAGTPPAPRAPADTLRRDTVPRDTIPRDTIPRDTIPRDTIPRDTARRDSARRDTTPRDSAGGELVRWAEGDSVVRELLGRQGYEITRYQGEEVTFLVGSRRIVLTGDPGAVQQGEAVVVGDTIVYDDSTGQIEVRRGRNGMVTLRDPARGQDVRAGWIRYNVRSGHGTVGEVSTAVESGEVWHVSARQAGIFGTQGDSGTTRFYGHDGSITSCDLTEPHYHFEARNLKVVRGQIMVARPAVLYIGEVPVLWLPFVFQDMREGRRSGFLAPRFGVAELVRNSPTYRRSVDNLGYYFALGDYVDASTWLDWRSGALNDERDRGFWRYNAEMRYNVLSRFLEGSLAAGYETWQGGLKNLTLSLSHNQRFSQRTSLTARVNYAQSTTLQRIGAYTPQAALATIRSNVNYQTRRGPFSLSLGADRTQYTGQDKVDQTLPTLSLTSEPISFGEQVTWTPSLRLTNTQRLDYTDVGLLGTRFRLENGLVRADTGRYDERSTRIDLETPLRIFDFNWTNSVSVNETERDAPVRATVYGSEPGDSAVRIFARAFQTQVNWTTGINLPSFSPGRWNITPSLSVSDVEPSAGFLVRSYLNGGDWVRQSKRPLAGLSAAPTFFRRFGGFGPFEAVRHQVSPSVSFSYAPAGRVGDDFLRAIGQNPQTYIGALQQAQVSLDLSTVFEAKLRPRTTAARPAAGDTAAADSLEGGAPRTTGGGGAQAGETVKLLALRFSPISYDFVRADTLGRGLTNETFRVDVATDLLPGFNANVEYSLFNGPATDLRSEFKPYLTGISSSFSIGRNSNSLVLLNRIFGRAIPDERPELESAVPTADDTLASRFARQPVAGQRARERVEQIPSGQGWRASLNFSMRRSRPADQLLGTVIEFDPELECAPYRADAFLFENCVLQVSRNPPAESPSALPGTTITRYPSQTSLGSQLSFDLTPNWTGSWQTSYDFTRSEFADHTVSLQRNLHDWRAVFAFTQSPNGNFAFTFFIALKAQPDLKFDYDQRSYRGAYQ